MSYFCPKCGTKFSVGEKEIWTIKFTDEKGKEIMGELKWFSDELVKVDIPGEEIYIVEKYEKQIKYNYDIYAGESRKYFVKLFVGFYTNTPYDSKISIKKYDNERDFECDDHMYEYVGEIEKMEDIE